MSRLVRREDSTVSVLRVSGVAVVTLLGAWLAAAPTVAATEGIALRSGTVRADRESRDGTAGRRWLVRLDDASGRRVRGALATAGVRIEAALGAGAYLVTAPAAVGRALGELPGVAWSAPYLPQDKLSPALADAALRAAGDVAVVVHAFPDADVRELAASLDDGGARVTAARADAGFGRVVLLVPAGDVEAFARDVAELEDVFWIDRRRPRRPANDTSIWVGQSGLDGGHATPVFDRGIYGQGQVGAVLDTGLDADSCYFRDDALGLPPTNLAGGTTVDLAQRKIIAVDFLDPAEDPADPFDWDTQGHGTHVSGTFAGDQATPLLHDAGDGMAPGARLVIQDAGYAADACGDLPGIGCPVADLNPVFQQAYDQGARVHSNSWNDNENAAVQNDYSDAAQDVDEFMWNHPDFLIVFAIGNDVYGGDGTMGSPSTAKNAVTVGATYKGDIAWALSDISAWGPTDDGRIKPDVVFPGASIQSAANDGDVGGGNCGTSGMTGTSMAAPGAAGMALLTREYFEKGFYPSGVAEPADGFAPSAALLKAMLINSAVSIDTDAESRPITIPSNEQGWGRVLLDDALYFPGDDRRLWVDDHAVGFNDPTDDDVVYLFDVTGDTEAVKVTLVWTDYPSTPAAATHLVNDLDLRVDGPTGSWLGNVFFDGVSASGGQPDRLNTVEQVLVPTPAPGLYAVRVSAHAVPMGPQPWALVVTAGDFVSASGPRPGYQGHTIDDAAPGGNGDGVLDPGESARIPFSLFNGGDDTALGTVAELFSADPSLLKVYGAPIVYGDIAPGASAAAATPYYEVTLEPSASCGQIVGTHIGLSGQGFEMTSGFSIAAGVDFVDYASTDTPLEIPRSSTSGVWSFLNVPDDFGYDEIDVTVNIDHQDISELQVLLYSPVNTAINLHRNTGAGVSGIHTTYDDETAPAGPGTMDDFLGLGPSGSWRLRAIDATSGGTPAGEIQDWTLHFRSDVPFACNPVGCAEAVPPPVGDTLTVDRAGADAVLDWAAVGGVSEYDVWSSADARFQSASFVGSTATTSLAVPAAGGPGLTFYTVRSVNACRWESED